MQASVLMDQTLSKSSDEVSRGLVEVWGPGKANPRMWCLILCINLDSVLDEVNTQLANSRWRRLFSTVWVGLIQSVEGLKKIQRQRAGECALFLLVFPVPGSTNMCKKFLSVNEWMSAQLAVCCLYIHLWNIPAFRWTGNSPFGLELTVYLSQPLFQLHAVMWLCSSQWDLSGEFLLRILGKTS